MLLNSSLASGLGRPDLAYMAQGGQALQTASPPTSQFMEGSQQVGLGFGGTMEARGPIVMLFLLTAGLVAFAYWVHPLSR
jgi:hypothetical protein